MTRAAPGRGSAVSVRAARNAADAGSRPARRMTPQRRREHLVAAALGLYARMPPSEVTVDDVTRAADVSRALFYRYFRGLEELHTAAVGRIAAELVERVSLPAEGTLPEQLRAALSTFLDVAQRHERAFVALLRGGSVISTGATDALVDGVRDHVVALIVARAGLGEPSALQLMTLRGWVATVEGACLTWLHERPVTRERLVAWLAAQLVGALATTASHE